MAALAEAFGWSEEFILLQLPLARGEQYYHWLLRKAGWRTYAPTSSAAEQVIQVEAALPAWVAREVDPELLAAAARFENTR